MLDTELQELFSRYIGLDTSRQDGKHYVDVVNLLGIFLESINFETTLVSIPESVAGRPNRVNLIARKHVDDAFPTLLIYNHCDVVPATYPDAFLLQEKEGKFFGRGTSDHKGSTIAVLSALKKCKEMPLRFNLIFIVTTDEETDQLEQLRYLTQHLRLPKNTIVFDPDTFAGGVSVATLGLMQLEIKVLGKAAHSGSSHMGVNAIEKASIIIEYLKMFEKTRLEEQVSQFASFPSTNMTHICSRCNINRIVGGIATNVIPDSCILTVDFRFIPESDVKKETAGILKRLHQFAKKQHIELESNIIASCESYASNHPEAEKLNEVYKKISGESGLYGVLGSTHAAQWCKELGLPHFGIGVARGDSNVHGINEFAYVKDLEYLEETMISFLKK